MPEKHDSEEDPEPSEDDYDPDKPDGEDPEYGDYDIGDVKDDEMLADGGDAPWKPEDAYDAVLKLVCSKCNKKGDAVAKCPVLKDFKKCPKSGERG